MGAESLLPVGECYRSVADSMDAIDPAWQEDRWRAALAAESAILSAALGSPAGRTVLNCSCGMGGRRSHSPNFGWRVTAAEVITYKPTV